MLPPAPGPSARACISVRLPCGKLWTVVMLTSSSRPALQTVLTRSIGPVALSTEAIRCWYSPSSSRTNRSSAAIRRAVQVAASLRRPFSSARPCGRRRAIQLFVQRFCRTSIRYSRPTNRPGFDSTTSARTRTRARHTSGRQPLHFYSPVRGASQHGVSAPYCGRLGLCQSVR